MARVDAWQLTRNVRFRLQDARESQQRSGRDGQGLGQPSKNSAALPPVETGLAPSTDSGQSLQKISIGSSVREAPYHRRHKLRKLPDGLFGGVERAHPSHHRLFFVPHIEEVPLLYLLNCLPRNLRKYPVCL